MGKEMEEREDREEGVDRDEGEVMGSGERREARTMGEFYAHGRQTGGGSPLYPPREDIDFIDIDFGFEDDDDTDVNHIPISLPEHLQVMGPPAQENLAIIHGPNSFETNGKIYPI